MAAQSGGILDSAAWSNGFLFLLSSDVRCPFSLSFFFVYDFVNFVRNFASWGWTWTLAISPVENHEIINVLEQYIHFLDMSAGFQKFSS